MFIVVKDQQGKGIPEVGVRLVTVGLTNPDGSNQSEYRHTDEAGNCAWTWYPHDVPGGYTIEVNNGVQNDKPQYSRESRHVTQAELEGQQQVFTLKSTGPVPPQPPSGGLTTIHCPSNGSVEGYGTVQEWFAIAKEIVARRGLAVIDQPNLKIFDQECRAKHPLAEVQFTSSGSLRPRLHIPSALRDNVPDCGKYARPCDFGDEGKPFFHDSIGSTTVWIPTGRPPSSQW